MKHIPLRCIPAALLAAALLAGCGAETAPTASAAAKPAGSKQPAALTATPIEPDSMMEPETVLETENAETPRITEQISLEKQCSAGYTTISVHLPKLESDSADAARINAEIARYYEYGVQEYVDRPEAADPAVWDFSIEAGMTIVSALWSAAATEVPAPPSTTAGASILPAETS